MAARAAWRVHPSHGISILLPFHIVFDTTGKGKETTSNHKM